MNEYEVRYEPRVGDWWPYNIYVNGRFIDHRSTLRGAKRFIRKHKKLKEGGVVFRVAM